MSKKITSKMLKDLIKEVLGEKSLNEEEKLKKYVIDLSDNPYEREEGEFESRPKAAAALLPGLNGTEFKDLDAKDPKRTLDLGDIDSFAKKAKDKQIQAAKPNATKPVKDAHDTNQKRLDNLKRALAAAGKNKSLEAVQAVIDRHSVEATKANDVNSAGTKLKDLKFLARGTDVDLPYFLQDHGEVKPENKQPLNSRALKKSFFELLSKHEELKDPNDPSNDLYITGENLKKVLTEPQTFGALHVNLVGLIRLSYDLYLKEFNDKSSIPTALVELESILTQVPTGSKAGDASQGLGAPIPQFTITSHMAEEGFSQKTSSLVVNIFRSSFQSPTVQGKIEQMQEFARKFNEGELKNESVGDQIKGTIVLDFFRRLVQDYDASSAGFLFESFLALLLDGTKMGGNQRLEDFIIGSAPEAEITSKEPVTLKLYQSGTSETTSALSTYERFFNQNPGGVITSISGIKMEGDIGVTLYEKKITQADFDYVMTDKPKKALVNKSPGKGLRYIQPSSGAPKMGVSIASSKKMGEIYFGFLSVEESEFFDQAQEAFTGAAEEIGKMFQHYNNFKFSSTEYLSGLDANKAADAVEDFLLMKKAAAQVFVKDDGKIAGTSGETINESKKVTPNLLKKLIEENFKK